MPHSLRNILMIFGLLTSLILSGQQVIPLWPGVPPNHLESEDKELAVETNIVRIEKVQTPTLEVYLPSKRNRAGQSVVICPGGGYRILAYDWEGTDVAKFLNSRGIAAFVLKYRLPNSSSNKVSHKSPLSDAQRAIRLVRSQAEDWFLDPNQIGIMGFSAGGHLASTASTHFDDRLIDPQDELDQLSARPDFSILIYPVITFLESVAHGGSRDNLLSSGKTPELIEFFSNHLQVKDNTPPTFLVHSSDDKSVPIANSLQYYQALLDKNIPAEMHTYDYGGHGYGLAIGQGHLSDWPELMVRWMESLE